MTHKCVQFLPFSRSFAPILCYPPPYTFASMKKHGNKNKGANPLKQKAKDQRTESSLDPPADSLNGEPSLTRGDRLIIHGGTKEGGGQVLRNSMSLSGILHRPIKVDHIRANRDKPGLKAQHLTGIRLVKDLYEGGLTCDRIHSSSITFSPGRFRARDLDVDIGTAGAPIRLTLGGGTNAENAPQIDYLIKVFNPIAQRMGIHCNIDVKKRGFYPRGMGLVELRVEPVRQLQPIVMIDPGVVTAVRSRAFVAGQVPAHVMDRMSKEAHRICRNAFGDKIEYTFQNVQETHETAYGDGTGIIITAHTSTGCIIAGSALGERGKPAEKVGTEAAEMLVQNVAHGGCVDEFLQDQLIIFMALAKGKSRLRTGPLSLHTETSIHFTSMFTGVKFNITPMDKSFLIECEGIGLVNENLNAPVPPSTAGTPETNTTTPAPAASSSVPSPAAASASAPSNSIPTEDKMALDELKNAYQSDG